MIIVGAGFAGLECARAAAVRGVKTLVLERKPRVGSAPHTTGLLVKEAADEIDVPQQFTRKVRRIRLYAPSLRFVDLHAPGYYFLATDTPRLMLWLAERAEQAGARIACGAPFRDARPHAGRIRVGDIETRFLVGADGARSRVARAFGLGTNRRFLVGAELEFEGVRGLDRDCLHCFLDSELAPGYLAWAVPGVNITQIGLACTPPAGPHLGRLLNKLQRVFDFTGARVVGRLGGLIPVGGLVRPFTTDRVMLLGDAAGMVSPLTAGGIYMALHHGATAGRAVADHLLDGGAHPRRALSPTRFGCKRLLRRALEMRPPNWIYDTLIDRPLFCALARTIFFHHRGLMSRAAWRDIAAVLARRPPAAESPKAIG